MACKHLIVSSTLNRNINKNSDFVFLKLHNVPENTISKDLGQVVKENLSPGLPEKSEETFMQELEKGRDNKNVSTSKIGR